MILGLIDEKKQLQREVDQKSEIFQRQANSVRHEFSERVNLAGMTLRGVLTRNQPSEVVQDPEVGSKRKRVASSELSENVLRQTETCGFVTQSLAKTVDA